MRNRIKFLMLYWILQAVSPAGAWADARDFYIQGILRNEASLKNVWAGLENSDSDSRILMAAFQQRLNPKDPADQRTFSQRYFYDSEFAEGPDSPVILSICGEGTCTAGAIDGAIADFARKFKAHLVALEHRYYGKSQPFPRLTPENLKYLNVDLALSDLIRFQDFAKQKFGLHGKWIAVGGSYSGALAAYLRALYPDKIAGALASSAPVRAEANFEEYDLHVSRVSGEACAAKMREVFRQLESALSDPERLLQAKKLFGSEEIRDPVDFLGVVADMAAIAVQYGSKESFCESLSSGDPLRGYANAGLAQLERFGLTPVQDSPQGAESLNPDDYLVFAGMRQWTYQTCTEFGFFQNAYHDPTIAVRSQRINMAYQKEICHRLFGIDQPVDTDSTNHSFYEPVIDRKATRIFFTNGSNDPWSTLSILPDQVSGLNPGLSAFLIQGGSHAEDLGFGDSPEIGEARRQFSELLSAWLK